VSTDLERIRRYYASFDELGRLARADGAVEFRRALALLDEHLRPHSRVLDLGGGPGRYAAALAERGHRVTLADLSPALLAGASDLRVRYPDRIESVDEVDARDLSRYADASFDAVVAFGPFYHLVDAAERERAASEIVRVLRARGVALVAFIPRLSGLAGLLARAAERPDQVPPGTYERAAATGVFRNGASTGFQEGYFAWPDELEALFSARGLRTSEIVSLRSLAQGQEAVIDRLRPDVRTEVEAVLARVALDPAVVATGGHAVLVTHKPGAR
jgi:SAM-dependent methyltransferase